MRGRPILGVVSGLFFGLFLAITLQQWSVWPLDNVTVIGLPVIGILLGLTLAAWAPFGRRDSGSEPIGKPGKVSPPEPDTEKIRDPGKMAADEPPDSTAPTADPFDG